ncbi:TlyA family RNA methyltransferase [Methylicorpusculum sp.]|uniref:TlyA family RNA methyltransferase n=1 Tax=Methylicorpusculum sp. TaxID=2713644 RepID=UPI002ABA6C7B|nr:TlyA family RNA methyltransferase [Methylicorpusculum sp.]MDZ4151689.1 TlyA family RNA methyltransferase [Methylicorpusculum sp.]
MAREKKRLDLILQERYPQYSRQQLQSWIMQGNVTIAGTVVTKAGQSVPVDADIVLAVQEPKFVGRAGFKLEKALDHFALDVSDLVALDAGLSTGGFTDCLLQLGAKKVYGVDVGYGQVHEKIRNDSRVVVRERTNLRTLTVAELGESVDLVTLDLSFISLLKVMDAVCALLKEGGRLVTLIKPQFEAGKEQVGRGGIVKDPAVHEQVIRTVTEGIQGCGFDCKGVVESPITGADGNKEFLAYFIKK